MPAVPRATLDKNATRVFLYTITRSFSCHAPPPGGGRQESILICQQQWGQRKQFESPGNNTNILTRAHPGALGLGHLSKARNQDFQCVIVEAQSKRTRKLRVEKEIKVQTGLAETPTPGVNLRLPAENQEFSVKTPVHSADYLWTRKRQRRCHTLTQKHRLPGQTRASPDNRHPRSKTPVPSVFFPPAPV